MLVVFPLWKTIPMPIYYVSRPFNSAEETQC